MAEKLHLQPDIGQCRTTQISDNTEADIGDSDDLLSDSGSASLVTASCMETFLDSEIRRQNEARCEVGGDQGCSGLIQCYPLCCPAPVRRQ